MKVFIWFVCLFVYAIITTVFKESGITLGAVPTVLLVGGILLIAKMLCKLWDKRNNSINNIVQKNNKIPNTTKSDANDTVSFCDKCGEKLIDNSNFCRKCGNSIEITDNSNIETTEDSSESLTPHDLEFEQIPEVIAQTPPTVKSKIKYCSRCGSSIDSVSKKCTGCGKQYFKGIRFKRSSAKTIKTTAIVAVILLLSTLCVYQHINNQNLKSDVAKLKRRNNEKSETITELNNTNSRLRAQIYNHEELSNFIDDYVVFIENDGTNQYHKFDCSLFKRESFWVLNIESAKNGGYDECSLCH